MAVPTAQAFLAKVAATPKRVAPPAGVGRLRKLASAKRWLTGALAPDTALWTDDVWVVRSTPVECGRSRETARRTDLAGWAPLILSIQYAEKTTCMSLDLASWKAERSCGEVTARSRRSADWRLVS